MMKLDFNNTKVSRLGDQENTGFAFEGLSHILTSIKGKKSDMEDVNTKTLLKVCLNLLLIFSFPLALKIYEMHKINELKGSKKQSEDVLNSINQELAKLSKEYKSYQHINDKAKEYKDKKVFFKKIAKNRIIIPRTLDIIQEQIPEKVWLEGLQLQLMENHTKVSLSGRSFNESNINLFAHSLNNILDKNSINVRTRDIKEGNSVVSVEFNLDGNTGETI